MQSLIDSAAEIAASAKGGFKKKIGMVKPLPGGKKTAVGGASAAPKSGVDFIEKFLLHKGEGKPKPQVKGESPDAYEYAPDRWAAFDFTDKPKDHLKSLADGTSEDSAIEWLKSNGTPVANGYITMLAKLGFPLEYAVQATKNHDSSEDSLICKGDVYSDTVTCAAVSLQDLQSRFPNMAKPHLAAIYPSVPKKSKVVAEWIKGDPKTADFSVIAFHADYKKVKQGGQYAFGHPDSRLPFDIFRHELGHAIGTGEIHKVWKQMIADTYGYPADGFFKLMKEKVSKYAGVYKPGLPNPDIYEALAETFAKVTSHDYKPGTLPRPIEDFIYMNMLGCKPKGGANGKKEE